MRGSVNEKSYYRDTSGKISEAVLSQKSDLVRAGGIAQLKHPQRQKPSVVHCGICRAERTRQDATARYVLLEQSPHSL